MSKYKININRPKLTEDEIARGRDFRSVLARTKVTKLPFYKTAWFWGGVTGLALFAGFIGFYFTSASIDKINDKGIGFGMQVGEYEDGKSIFGQFKTEPIANTAKIDVYSQNVKEVAGSDDYDENAGSSYPISASNEQHDAEIVMEDAVTSETSKEKLLVNNLFTSSYKGVEQLPLKFTFRLEDGPIEDRTQGGYDTPGGLWRVYWSKGDTMMGGIMNMVIDNGKVSATISWKYLQYEATEYLGGSYDQNEGTFILKCVKTEDPNHLLSKDHRFALRISKGLTFIDGKTAKGNGRGKIYYGERNLFKNAEPAAWDGRFSGNRIVDMSLSFAEDKKYFIPPAVNELGRLYLTMRDNEEISIEILKDTNNKDDLYPVRLNAVFEYLKEKGISEKRFSVNKFMLN